jgi:hypothetical protein
MREGALYIGVDWFSTAHDDPDQFSNLGVTSYVDVGDMEELFSGGFDIIFLERKHRKRYMPYRPDFQSLDIVARKR